MSDAEESSTETASRQLRVLGMSCAACQSHVRRALEAVPGVREARVNLLLHTAEVDAPGVPEPRLIAAIRAAGYDATDVGESSGADSGTDARGTKEHEEVAGGGSLGPRALGLLVAGTVAMWISMPVAMASEVEASGMLGRLEHAMRATTPEWLMSLPAALLRWVLLGLAAAAMAVAGPEVYAAAWRAARHRATNMNTLVALGTLAAFTASLPATVAPEWAARNGWGAVYFEAVVLILGFLLAGRWLEARARRRATADLRHFAALDAVADARVLDLAPDEAASASEASLLAASSTILPGDALVAGDLLRVLPGDRLPADGVILAGRGAIDESMLTGEPLPVTRGPGDRVAGGSVNVDGVLIVRATAVGRDGTLAQMRRLLHDAQTSRAALEGLADRVSRVFVPGVLGLAAITFAAWWWVGSASHALAMAVSVLVVACPCAMGLAVPAAVSVALGSAARAGVLIKGGDTLERLSDVRRVAFDKTGTLTTGKPRIGEGWVRSASSSLDEDTLLRWVLAIERGSNHPLAGALIAFAEAHLARHGLRDSAPAHVQEPRVLPGVGLEATVDDVHILLGNVEVVPGGDASLAILQRPSSERSAQGEALDHASSEMGTPVYMVVNGIVEAGFFASDEVRPEAAAAVAAVRRLGCKTAMLTGDVSATATSVASMTGVAEQYASLKPADKLARLKQWHAVGEHVAMVGDGLNDAAALAQADVGFAMSGGTDLAREAGHVLLLRNDLRLVPWTLRHGRRAARIMRGNLFWALGYNVVGIPLAAGVFLPHWGVALSPAFASAAMAFSSIAVLLNSLRLARAGRLPGV